MFRASFLFARSFSFAFVFLLVAFAFLLFVILGRSKLSRMFGQLFGPSGLPQPDGAAFPLRSQAETGRVVVVWAKGRRGVVVMGRTLLAVVLHGLVLATAVTDVPVSERVPLARRGDTRVTFPTLPCRAYGTRFRRRHST